MTTIIRRSNGDTFTGKIQNISTRNSTKSPVVDLPGVNADVVFKMGKNNRQYTLKGFVTGSSEVTFLENALNNTGSIYFYSDTFQAVLINNIQVLYYNLQWQDTGNRPLERTFSIECVEII